MVQGAGKQSVLQGGFGSVAVPFVMRDGLGRVGELSMMWDGLKSVGVYLWC